MTKYLIDIQDGKVKSGHDHPLDFSIAGKFVIDVPSLISDDVSLSTDSATDLENAKVSAYQNKMSLANEDHDELVSSPKVDNANSTLFGVGPDKRTFMMPNGQIVTPTIAIGSAITQIFAHWYGFLLHTDPQIDHPSPLLYNYDSSSFQEFIPSTFTVEIRDSTNTSTLLVLSPDQTQTFSFGPGNIRLRFTNTSSTKIYYLSDWILMW
jgi:hypothetical protein